MTYEWFSCFWCNQGKFRVQMPDNYDGKPPIRTVCQKSTCQAKEKLLKNESERQANIHRLEEELAQSQAETEKLKERLAENQKKVNQNSKYQAKNHSPTAPSSEPNSSDLNCSLCHKYIESQYFEWAGSTKLIICATCRPRFVANQVATEYIMNGKKFNIEKVEYLALEDKITLRALQKIQQGEAVNIDNLPLDELNKQALTELQKQNPPQNNNPSSANYLTKCQDCGKNYEVTANPPCCYYCQSRNIETFKNGVLQDLPPDSNNTNNQVNKQVKNIFDSPAFWITVLVIILLLAIPYFIWRQKKVKKYKKIGKKVPWWF